MTLNLFLDASYPATLESSTVPDPADPTRFIWHGTLDGIPNGRVTFAINGASVSATLMLPDALYHVIDTDKVFISSSKPF